MENLEKIVGYKLINNRRGEKETIYAVVRELWPQGKEVQTLKDLQSCNEGRCVINNS